MWKETVDYLTVDIFELTGSVNDTVNFFIYDTIKIWFLLITIIFLVSYLRTYFNTEYVRAYLQGKSEFTGNVLAALFGIVTPFCSCSAIPLFLGFIQARIPLGVTFSYLISAPLNNEIAIALLFGLFGWKIAAIYIGFGLLVAILGGYLIGKLKMEKYIIPDIKPSSGCCSGEIDIKLNFKKRVKESWTATIDLFKKIYIYVVIGVFIGAFIHGYVPAETIATYTGGDAWYAVPLAVLMGIPMYSNAAGVMPLVEVLTSKGMLLGSALSFMMAVTALSLPEAMILKSILQTRLIVIFFSIVGFGIVCIGYIFNYIL
ncbi:MAG: permease [Campylobacterota bacterium]|nr:permease [Campylobacterota bacterium]